jgi:hypothetical protein
LYHIWPWNGCAHRQPVETGCEFLAERLVVAGGDGVRERVDPLGPVPEGPIRRDVREQLAHRGVRFRRSRHELTDRIVETDAALFDTAKD